MKVILNGNEMKGLPKATRLISVFIFLALLILVAICIFMLCAFSLIHISHNHRPFPSLQMYFF